MKDLDAQEKFDALVEAFSDEHCFIREAHVISPSYVQRNPKSTVAPESLAGVRLWISSPEEDHPGLELVFFGVELFRVELLQPFTLSGRISGGTIMMSFSPDGEPAILAQRCVFQVLGTDSWGSSLRYGYENIFDEGGFSAF